jgi:hypothetical protein
MSFNPLPPRRMGAALLKVSILNLLHISDPSKESAIQVSNEANDRDSSNDVRSDGDDTESKLC